MTERAYVVGVGMTPFTTPRTGESYDVMGERAARAALPDASTSGGLLSNGHPMGATGLAQCSELVWQLHGEAGPRQVEDVTLVLQHNIGLGGAAVATLYEKVA